MHFNIQIGKQQNAQEARLLAEARALKERTLSVKVDLEAVDSDRVQIEKHGVNDNDGLRSYRGFIGADGFATGNATFRNGQLDAFAVHDPKSAPGETVKFHTQTSQATGMRAGISSALGSVSGALGNAGAWFLAQAMTADSKVGSMMFEAASKPLLVGSELFLEGKRNVADPGTKDEYYAISRANGDYEQYLFTADNRLEVDIFPKQNPGQ